VHAEELLEEQAANDPLTQFELWFDEARGAVDVPEAMAIATATTDGVPSVRMVLLKDADDEGFSFFSNYESRKGRELEANAHAALLFYWHPLGRQVRVEGTVERLSDADSDRYFDTRPLGARLSAWVSRQSEVIASRDELMDRVETMRQHLGSELTRPLHWGGYRLVPSLYEFWQHREDRLHDRLQYRREDGTWVRERLSP
jgi:pyridoxamine 5'-phosphate oxidase